MSMIKTPTPTTGNGTSLAALRTHNQPAPATVATIGLDTVQGFETLQRMAKMFTTSQIVPQTFRNLADACIALNMSIRMKADPMMVMQNLYIVHGRPAWSSAFMIATFNSCGKFSSIKYRKTGQPGTDTYGCIAYTTELATGEQIEGPEITIGLAKKEGWYGKNGSKWQTMPDLMLRYRAASWMIRTVAPEISMGIKSEEEVRDTWDLEQTGDGQYVVTQEDLRAAKEEAGEPQKVEEAVVVEEPVAEQVKPAEPAQEAPKRAPRTTTVKADTLCYHFGKPMKPIKAMCELCHDKACTMRAN